MSQTCPDCGWSPPASRDTTAADQIVAHAINVKHPSPNRSKKK